jgi:hypothetical protein
MPVALERELKRRAKKKGIEDKDAYVYGTLRKTGWKPKRERKMSVGGSVPGDNPGASAMLIAKLDRLVEFSLYPEANAALLATMKKYPYMRGHAERLGLIPHGAPPWHVSAPSSQVSAAVSPHVPSPHPYVKPASLPGHVVSPDTLNIPPQPVVGNKERISLLNRLDKIRQRNKVRQGAFRQQQLRQRPSSWDPDRSLLSGSFSARLDQLLEFADPRPRNPLGEFTGSSEGVPDPNTMVKTYAQKATDAAVGGAAGAVGGATAGAGGLALRKILEMVKKRKAKI